MTSQQVIHLIIIVLVVSTSAISWMWRQFKLYQAEQSRKEAERRYREELLRTGRGSESSRGAPTVEAVEVQAPRPIPTSDADARRRLIELAQRRAAELAEKSRQAPPSTPKPAAPMTRPAPMLRPTTPVFQTAESRRGADAEKQTEVRRRAVEERKKIVREKQEAAAVEQIRQRSAADGAAKSAAADRQYAQQTGVPTIAQSEIRDEASQVSAPRAAFTSTFASLKPGALSPAASLDQWRKAFILNELLSPPLCDRPDRSMP